MWNRIGAAAFVAVCLAASASVRAQQQAAAPAELTALDYFQIQQLVARYAVAIDTCSNNGYDYADLFTADGAFVPSFEGKQLGAIQGRERLAAVRAADRTAARTCLDRAGRAPHLHESCHYRDVRRRLRHRRHADDRSRRRSQQDRVRGPLRGHVRADAAGMAFQTARAPRPASGRATHHATRGHEIEGGIPMPRPILAHTSGLRFFCALAAGWPPQASLPAPTAAQQVTMETLLDRIQIEERRVRYYYDLSMGKAHEMSEYFTEDAMLDVGRHRRQRACRGIEKLYAGGPARDASRPRNHMLLTNPVIEIKGTRAQAHVLWTGVSNKGVGETPSLYEQGREDTELVKVNGKWLVSKRYISSDSGLPDRFDQTFKQRGNPLAPL